MLLQTHPPGSLESGEHSGVAFEMSSDADAVFSYFYTKHVKTSTGLLEDSTTWSSLLKPVTSIYAFRSYFISRDEASASQSRCRFVDPTLQACPRCLY